MRTKRPMLASSSGASTSSRMQKGEGLYWKIAKRSEIAVERLLAAGEQHHVLQPLARAAGP